MRSFVLCLLVACGEEPAPPCPVELHAEVTTIESALAAFEAWELSERTRVVFACAAIAHDLAGDEFSFATPPTLFQAEMACHLARLAVEERIDALEGGLAVSWVDDSSCEIDTNAKAACRDACGGAISCRSTCDAKAIFEAACTLARLDYTSSDALLDATLEENRPATRFIADEVEERVELGSDALAAGIDKADRSLDTSMDSTACREDEFTLVAARRRNREMVHAFFGLSCAATDCHFDF